MPRVTVVMPDLESAFAELIQQRIDAALSVADDVPGLIFDAAVLNNEDVDGNQMPRKQPRPKNYPQNNPDLPLIGTTDAPENMMSKTRWTVERTGSDTEATITYTPPDFFDDLITKDPSSGGRRWITRDKINADVVALIQEKMAVALRTGNNDEPRGFDAQAVPEGFERVD